MDLSRTSTIFVATYPREGTETKIGRRQERKCAIVATYPREGTETEGGAVAPFVPVCCNLSPRGDGNPCRDLPSRRGCNRCNLSPRGDGNTISCPGFFGNTKGVATYPREGTETKLIFGDFLQVVRLQLIPARGRKLIIVRKAVRIKALQLIPARGRKLLQRFKNVFCISCNLSPRGDGKWIVPKEFHWRNMLQLIPARGRKQRFFFAGHIVRYRCNLSPRGDGNFPPSFLTWFHVSCNLSPRGDGNGTAPETELSRHVATYPREGTETRSPTARHHCAPRLQLIPARGRKL